MPTTNYDAATRELVDGRITGTDTVGAPVVERHLHEARWRLTLGGLEPGDRAGQTGLWVTPSGGPIALDEIDALIADLQAIQSAGETWDDQQQVRAQLEVVEDLEQRLAAAALVEWMDATGTTVTDYLRGTRDAREVDEDDAIAMGPIDHKQLVDALDEVVEALELEAADEPQRPHPSSPDSDEQRDFRAAVGI